MLLIWENEGRISGMNRILRAVMIERLALLAGCVSLINGEHSKLTRAFLRTARFCPLGRAMLSDLPAIPHRSYLNQSKKPRVNQRQISPIALKEIISFNIFFKRSPVKFLDSLIGV